MATFNYFNFVDLIQVYQHMVSLGYQWTGNGVVAAYASGNSSYLYCNDVNGNVHRWYSGPSISDPLNAAMPNRDLNPMDCMDAQSGLWTNSNNWLTQQVNYATTRPYDGYRYAMGMVGCSTIAYGDPIATMLHLFWLDIPKEIQVMFESIVAGPGNSGYIHTTTRSGVLLSNVLIGGISLAESAIQSIAARLAELIQIINNITVEPSSVAVDFTPVVAKLDELVKDSSFIAKEMGGSTDLTAVETALDTIATNSGTITTRPDLTAQLNELNRQLSLIHSRLYWRVDEWRKVGIKVNRRDEKNFRGTRIPAAAGGDLPGQNYLWREDEKI